MDEVIIRKKADILAKKTLNEVISNNSGDGLFFSMSGEHPQLIFHQPWITHPIAQLEEAIVLLTEIRNEMIRRTDQTNLVGNSKQSSG